MASQNNNNQNNLIKNIFLSLRKTIAGRLHHYLQFINPLQVKLRTVDMWGSNLSLFLSFSFKEACPDMPPSPRRLFNPFLTLAPHKMTSKSHLTLRLKGQVTSYILRSSGTWT